MKSRGNPKRVMAAVWGRVWLGFVVLLIQAGPAFGKTISAARCEPIVTAEAIVTGRVQGHTYSEVSHTQVSVPLVVTETQVEVTEVISDRSGAITVGTVLSIRTPGGPSADGQRVIWIPHASMALAVGEELLAVLRARHDDPMVPEIIFHTSGRIEDGQLSPIGPLSRPPEDLSTSASLGGVTLGAATSASTSEPAPAPDTAKAPTLELTSMTLEVPQPDGTVRVHARSLPTPDASEPAVQSLAQVIGVIEHCLGRASP